MGMFSTGSRVQQRRSILILLVLASLSLRTSLYAVQGTDLPYSTIEQRMILMHPSGASLQIPPEVFDGTQTKQFTTYLSRVELERVRNPQGDEWDRSYSAVLNAALPFESCSVHVGTEPFGPGRAFSDLQMRAYFVDGSSKPVLAKIASSGLAQTFGNFRNIKATAPQAVKTWTLVSITATLQFADYGAPAKIDFYVKEFDQQTVIMVFMSSPNPRWPWEMSITDIVDSFTWPGH